MCVCMDGFVDSTMLSFWWASKDMWVCVYGRDTWGGRAPKGSTKIVGILYWRCNYEFVRKMHFWNFVLSIFFLQKVRHAFFTMSPQFLAPCPFNMFPITPHFHPYMLCSTLSSGCLYRSGSTCIYFYVWRKYFHIRESPKVSTTFFLWWVNERSSLQKENLELGMHPQLINRIIQSTLKTLRAVIC
jgi:hypothetical protein